MENKTIAQNAAEISAAEASETLSVPEHLSFERWEDIGTPDLDLSPEHLAKLRADLERGRALLKAERDRKIKRIEALDWHGDVSSMRSMMTNFLGMIDEGATDEQLQAEIDALI